MTSDHSHTVEERPLRAAREPATDQHPVVSGEVPPVAPSPPAPEGPAPAAAARPTTGGRPPVDDEPEPGVLWRWVGRAVRPYVGWILIGLGALFILVGYLGVSREAIVGKQIPYLVSGGIGGVLLAVVGAYFLGTEELRRDSGRLDKLERQIEELHAALLSRPDAPRFEAPAPNGSHPPAQHVVAVATGEAFHRPDCRLADGKEVTRFTPAEARTQGLRPCRVCDPVPTEPA